MKEKEQKSASKVTQTLSDASRNILMNWSGLKHEIELYEFAKKILNDKIKLLGLKPR